MTANAKISLIATERYINSISDELIQSFQEVINGDWGLDQSGDIKNVFLIDIGVFADGYGARTYPSDNEATQLGYKKHLPKFTDGPLRDDNYKHGLDISFYDFANENDLKETDKYYGSLTKFYFEWISYCWDLA